MLFSHLLARHPVQILRRALERRIGSVRNIGSRHRAQRTSSLFEFAAKAIESPLHLDFPLVLAAEPFELPSTLLEQAIPLFSSHAFLLAPPEQPLGLRLVFGDRVGLAPPAFPGPRRSFQSAAKPFDLSSVESLAPQALREVAGRVLRRREIDLGKRRAELASECRSPERSPHRAQLVAKKGRLGQRPVHDRRFELAEPSQGLGAIDPTAGEVFENAVERLDVLPYLGRQFTPLEQATQWLLEGLEVVVVQDDRREAADGRNLDRPGNLERCEESDRGRQREQWQEVAWGPDRGGLAGSKRRCECTGIGERGRRPSVFAVLLDELDRGCDPALGAMGAIEQACRDEPGNGTQRPGEGTGGGRAEKRRDQRSPIFRGDPPDLAPHRIR